MAPNPTKNGSVGSPCLSSVVKRVRRGGGRRSGEVVQAVPLWAPGGTWTDMCNIQFTPVAMNATLMGLGEACQPNTAPTATYTA
jgi:hypothetical protein